MANQSTGFTRIYKAVGYSIRGLTAAWRHEAAFRQETIVAIIAIMLVYWLDISAIERILLISSVVLVIVTEILNSAIESTIDRISEEHHELSGRAKDMGSAAVFVTMLLALFVWVTVLWQYLPYGNT